MRSYEGLAGNEVLWAPVEMRTAHNTGNWKGRIFYLLFNLSRPNRATAVGGSRLLNLTEVNLNRQSLFSQLGNLLGVVAKVRSTKDVKFMITA